MKNQTVLISSEHTLLRDFLRGWLSRFHGMRVVAESNNASQAMDMVKKHSPTLVLMDFDTLDGPGLDFLSKIRADFPKVKVILYFSKSDEKFAMEIMRAGASGFLLKSANAEDMEMAIKTVVGGNAYVSSEFLRSPLVPA